MKWRQRMISGLGIGSFIYLTLVFFNGETIVTVQDVLIVFSISIFVGLTSYIFDLESLNYVSSLSIHYVLVLIFVSGLFKLCYPSINLGTLIVSNTGIYIISYIVTLIKIKATVKELNESLEMIKTNS